MIIRIFILLLGIGLSITAVSQEQTDGFECVYYMTDGSVYRGTHIEHGTKLSRLVLVTGDTIDIPLHLVEQRYRSGDFHLYKKGRFHYKTGSYIDVTQGFGASQDGALTQLDLSYNRRITGNFTLGAGVGLQRNFSFLNFTTSDGRRFQVDIQHASVPLFVQGKYFLNHNRRSFYVHSRVGYTIGRTTVLTEEISNNGFLATYGIGFLKSTKHRVKTFIQLSQTHNYAAGSSFAWGDLGNSTFDYELWLNRIALTWGIQINLAPKMRKF